jgi:hypothetical protein
MSVSQDHSEVNDGSPFVKGIFPKAMFWDVDVRLLSIEFDGDFIIDRVLAWNMGQEDFFETLDSLYPIYLIKSVALNSRQIKGNENIESIAIRYNLDPLAFNKYIADLKSKYKGEKYIGMEPYRSAELSKAMQEFASKSYAKLSEEEKLKLEALGKEYKEQRQKDQKNKPPG